MSDALMDISHDGQINRWCNKHLQPIAKAYNEGSISPEEAIRQLLEAKLQPDMPSYCGYWSSPPERYINRFIVKIRKGEKL